MFYNAYRNTSAWLRRLKRRRPFLVKEQALAMREERKMISEVFANLYAVADWARESDRSAEWFEDERAEVLETMRTRGRLEA